MGYFFHQRKDTESKFIQILEANQTYVYSLCRRMLGDNTEAEDATQEVFIKLWKNIMKVNPAYGIRTWLYKVAVNHCIDVCRIKNIKGLNSNLSIEAISYNNAIEYHELAEVVQKLILLLPRSKGPFLSWRLWRGAPLRK